MWEDTSMICDIVCTLLFMTTTSLHVCSHSPLTLTSPASLIFLTCAAERGCGFGCAGGGCGCDRCSPRVHCHHSDGVVGTTV